MCLVVSDCCGEKETVLGSHKAPGNCPRCGGAVTATDLEKRLRFCFLPVCVKNNRKYYCARCSRRLVTIP